MLNDIIQPRRININELMRRMADNSLYVDNSFQRKLVWTEKQKIRLIETVLIGYPMPEIYLWDQKPNPKTGIQRQSIVDGQQRLSAMRAYQAGEFYIKKNAVDAANKDRDFAGKGWLELSLPDQHRFLEYEINARSIPSSTSETEIRHLFTRLNETDKSLNPQELRHARLQGTFLQASEEIANLDFWSKVPVFTQNHIRRMKDVEFASALLTFLRNGIVSDTAESLNSMYNRFSDSYSFRSKDFETSREILSKLSDIYMRSSNAKEFISRETHLYTLFVLAFLRQRETGINLKLDEVESFFTAYKNFDPDKEHSEGSDGAKKAELLRRYRQGSSSRIGSKSSREQRIFAMQDYLRL